MKLWKAKKPISCVPGKSAALKNEDKLDGGNNSGGIPLTPIVSGEFQIILNENSDYMFPLEN